MERNSKLELSRQDWLIAGLDALFAGGPEAVKVERIAAALGVTKGSFYWHFKNHRALCEAMVHHWRGVQFGYLSRFRDQAVRPADRLKQLFKHISSKDARHDIAMRAWARTDRAAAAAVAELDRARIEAVASLFEELGFAPDEARFRAHAVYYFQIGEQVAFSTSRAADRARYFARLGELLGAPASGDASDD
ncbi:MAG: TetR/AcrR family transcriptional regulator [Parvularculaceae bacterium]